MRSIVLATALAMAVPVAAYANPPQTQSDRDRAFEHERYDRWNDSHWAHDYHGRWRTIGQTFNARNDSQLINFNGRYHMLRLQAVRGEPRIDRVVVTYSDGDTQTVQLDSRLGDGAGEVIKLDPSRRITRVTVYTERNTRGLYSVYAG
ncbi:MAG TPA: hypothetical protein VHT91_33845 [Kofleriaceae bacterium]|jgi:hypothetical protein|nr:hypothetical protein [Kofleriaceae bacterium]